MEQQREVFAIPGSIMSKMSWGPNLLIKHVHLPHADRALDQQLVNVACSGGRVWKVLDVTDTSTLDSSVSWREVDGKGGLLISS